MVDGDAPHTLAFIVSSVFKVLLVVCTQALRSEANFASVSGGADGGPAPMRSFRWAVWLSVRVSVSLCA